MIKKIKKWWYKSQLIHLDLEMSIFAIEYKDWKRDTNIYKQLLEEIK
jgi:hypothetical protein